MSISPSTSNRGFWNNIPLAYMEPPSMTIPESEKGKEYHDMWARYFLSRQNSEWVNGFRENYSLNLGYSIDNRWGEEADIRMFLGDGASQTTRIPFKQPLMNPMLTRMVGAVDNISIAAKAEPATQYFAQTRKEQKLMERMNMSAAAAAGPMMEGAYQSMGVYADPQETEKVFDMTYQDHIERGANSLMSMLALRNQLNETKRQAAAYMALSGMVAFHNFINGSNIETELCEPREVGFDSSALRPDAADGQFMYVCPLMDVGAIAERWEPSADVVQSLDTWARWLPSGTNFQAGWPQSRPRVFTIYWKDFKKVERGFVIKDGELDFCTINAINPDTGKPDYTDKDLVTPPENKFTRAWTAKEKSDKKQTRTIQVVRYCSMIPWEYLPGGYTKGQAFSTKLKVTPKPSPLFPTADVVGDIVLDYGEYPLQEADPDDVYSVEFPIKISMWRYLGGNVVAPMTAARDPQRWMNQLTSDVAWRLRKAGGKSTLIAKEVLTDTDLDEQDVQLAVKEGNTLLVSASQLGGLQNSTGSIDSSPDAGFYNMMRMIPEAKAIAESAVGVYEQNYGAPQGQDQLVGTLQLQLQQAGVMQQPFYAAIADVYRQQNQFYAQAGKQFYCRMPWVLAQMTGEEDMAALVESKDMQLEQFRVKIDLAPDGAQQRLITDQQTIPGLMQLGMLDPMTAAQLMGRATPEDVYAAARKFTKQAQEAAAQQEQAAMQQQQQQQEAMESAAIMDEEKDISKQQQDAELKMAALQQKLAQPEAQAAAEWMKPPDPLKPTSA